MLHTLDVYFETLFLKLVELKLARTIFVDYFYLQLINIFVNQKLVILHVLIINFIRQIYEVSFHFKDIFLKNQTTR